MDTSVGDALVLPCPSESSPLELDPAPLGGGCGPQARSVDSRSSAAALEVLRVAM